MTDVSIPAPTDGDPVNLPGDLQAFAAALAEVLDNHLDVTTEQAQAAGAAAATSYASSLDATKMKTVLDGDNAFTTGLSTSMESAAAALPPHKLAGGNEPRGALVHTFDDGYAYAVAFFALLDSKGIKGTLFGTQNWMNGTAANPRSVTLTAAGDTVNRNAHGFSTGSAVILGTLVGGAGLSADTVYYVVSPTTNTFKLALTVGGSAIDITTDGTAIVSAASATWADAYITSAQVQTIAGNGHEIGTHGFNHESVVNYRNSNGDAALAALYDGAVAYIESTYTGPGGAALKVRTGAYPAGASDRRCREIMGRKHLFFRGTNGVVATDAWNPYDVPSIDVQSYTEAQLKAFVDTAVATDSLVVFLTHGVTAGTPADRTAQLTKISNVIDYATSLGVRQTTFADAMTERTARRSPGSFEDTSGNRFNRRLRTQRMSWIRSDNTAANAWAEIDLVNNALYFDGDNGRAVEFRQAGLRVTGTVAEVGRRLTYSATATSGSPTITAITGFSADNTIVGVTASDGGVLIPANAIVDTYTSSTITLKDATTGLPVNATGTGTITLTLGYPTAPPFRAFGISEFIGSSNPRSIGTASSTGWDVYNHAGTRTARFSAAKLERVSSGTFTIDTAGGNLELEAARVKFQPDGGSAYMSIAPSQPSDGSIGSSEQVVYPVHTTGAAKHAIRGKEADGTVRQIQLNMTPVALAAAATDAATTQTLANDLRTKLIATGMYS